MPKRRLYDESLQDDSDSATLFYLKSEKQVEPGWIRYITFASAYDNSQADRNIEFGKLIGDKFLSLEGTDAGDKSIPTWFVERTHHFRTGELPAFRFTNATVGNRLYGFLEGYEVPMEEVVTTG